MSSIIFSIYSYSKTYGAGKKFGAITDEPAEIEDVDEYGRRKGAPTENMAIPVSIYHAEQE